MGRFSMTRCLSRRIGPSVGVLLAFFFASSFTSEAQSKTQESKISAGDSPQIVLKANTRLVVLNVVAVDRKGQPVADLEAQDFTVLEDGKGQKISSFSFQHPGAFPASPAR